MALNTFNVASMGDGTPVTSTMNMNNLVSTIQAAYPSDIYFDTTAELGLVYVYYTHQALRQEKKLVHDAISHQATVTWSPYAQDGTWYKNKIKAFDKDGATVTLLRADIGTGEDVTHASGFIYLNT